MGDRSTNKRAIKAGAGILFLGLVATLILTTLSTYETLQEAKDSRLTIPASIDIFTPEGKTETINGYHGVPVLFVHFSPFCDHCHGQARELLRHQSSFHHSKVIFLSSATADQVRDFLTEIPELEASDYATYALTERGFFDYFGTSSTPAVVGYDANGGLTHFFEGEVAAERLLPASK